MLQLLFLLSYVFLGGCQDFLAYPVPLTTAPPNTDKRDPLYAPSICPPNHLLYPGNQQTDWICDCEPGYVYYPEKNGCFAVYRQGPCEGGEYLILHEGEFRPRCEINPCGRDGVVKYQGLCHPLEKPGGPCERKNDTEPISVLTVIRGTLKLECVTSTNTLSLIIVPPSCPPGSRRSHNNDCRSSPRGL